MVQATCRIWNLSISTLIILTVYNIVLTAKYLQNQDDSKSKPQIQKHEIVVPKCTTDGEAVQDFETLNLDLNLGRWDDNRKFKLFDNIIVGDKYVLQNTIRKTCLATQSSLEKLFSIREVSNNWDGPISLAVFAAHEEELNALLMFILYLRKCDSKIRENVSFHLGLAKERKPKHAFIDLQQLQDLDCQNPAVVYQSIVKSLNKVLWRTKLPYPQNHMRNLARKNCQTHHVFLTDVDIIPSKGMAQGLDKFIESGDCAKKCVYVVPTYELDERVSFPANKTELIRLADKGLARPFHQKVFIYNQYATNFSRWEHQNNEESKVHISHPVTNFEFLYEPFYIAPDTVPKHDERFIGYGYTRNSQVYEMFVAGYEFMVLSPIFTCHWGLQVKRTRPPWREHQNNLNRKQFETFKREIFAKYNKDPLNMMSARKF